MKQEFGAVNPVFLAEEEAMLAEVAKALRTGNAALIGNAAEKQVFNFLRRYLPNPLNVVTGKFMTPSGLLSPQIDIMVVDGRYPFLSHHQDGTVVVMLHSLLETVEVKATVGKREVFDMLAKARQILALSIEVFTKHGPDSLNLSAIGFQTSCLSDTLEKHFFKDSQFDVLDLTVLRFKDAKAPGEPDHLGLVFHKEPEHPESEAGTQSHSLEDQRSDHIDPSAWLPTVRETLSPLSDFYYYLVQNAYYRLGARDFGFNDIGRHIMDYLSFGTFRPLVRKESNEQLG